jgi:hypothetical protein
MKRPEPQRLSLGFVVSLNGFEVDTPLSPAFTKSVRG